MARQMRMRAVRRKEIDDEKLALAFLLLAKVLNEQDDESGAMPSSEPAETERTDEAA
jgi:hypothetical protein